MAQLVGQVKVVLLWLRLVHNLAITHDLQQQQTRRNVSAKSLATKLGSAW
jgi:hypothetical protein